MATRGSALSRSVEFFRSANLDEARVAFQLVREVMEKRLAPAQPTLPFNNKARATRKGKPTAATTAAAATQQSTDAPAGQPATTDPGQSLADA